MDLHSISKNNIQSHEWYIVNKVVHLIDLKKFNVYNDIDDISLIRFFKDYGAFDKYGYYEDFGPLKEWIPDSILNRSFTKTKVDEMILNLEKRTAKKLADTDLIDKDWKLIENDQDISMETKTARLSYPVFLGDKILLVKYSTKSGFYDEHGSSETLIFCKNADDWEILIHLPF